MRSYPFLVLLCLLVSISQVNAQTVQTAIAQGQTLRLEWVHQQLGRSDEPDYPLYPDQFSEGNWELRAGLELSANSAGQIEGRFTYLSYLAIPKADQNGPGLPEPTFIDTRFPHDFASALPSHFMQMTEIPFFAGCDERFFREWLQTKQERLEKELSTTYRDFSRRQAILETSLPAAFTAENLAELLCKLLANPLPADEAFLPLQSVGDKSRQGQNFFRMDYAPKPTVLQGRIESPAGPAVRVQFYNNDNWFEFWRDTVIQLDSAGGFTLAFPLDIPQTISIFHAYKTLRFYMRPGDSLAFHTNANAMYRSLEFSGTAAENQRTFLDFYHEMRGDTLYRSFDFQLLEYHQLEFLQKLLWKEKRELQFVQDRRDRISVDFASFLEREIRLGYAQTIWEAAHRFYAAEGKPLHPQLAQEAQQRIPLLYRLPPQRTFDASAEEYFRFQMLRLKELGISYRQSGENNLHLRSLLLSKETMFRYYGMLLFREYSDEYGLDPANQILLNELLEQCRDSSLIREMKVFSTPGAKGHSVIYYIPNLPVGRKAPDWSFTDREGISVSLSDLKGEKVLLHIGWLQHLEPALRDIELFRRDQAESPTIVHLMLADSRSDFERDTREREGLFVYVPKESREMLRDSYRIENKSNHYLLLDETGTVLAGNYELGTPHQMRAVWDKVNTEAAVEGWTTEERLQFWRILGAIVSLLLLLSLVYLWRRRQLGKLELQKRRLLELELRGIRSQMNPHFLFNAMGSIQNLMRTNKLEKADLYLSRFAGLMRRILRNSGEEFIPLSEEMETIEQYCVLEALRHPFAFAVNIDPAIDPHNTYVPAMILQPLVENAIVHGLLPKQGDKQLQIELYLHEKGLICKIIDNGIGIDAAELQKKYQVQDRKSYGLALVRQRLAILGKKGAQTLLIEDRSGELPPKTGTRVSFIIPVES